MLIADFTWWKNQVICCGLGGVKAASGVAVAPEYRQECSAHTKLVMKPGLSEIPKCQEAIRAAYRQVFERSVGHAYELAVAGAWKSHRDAAGLVQLSDGKSSVPGSRLGKSPGLLPARVLDEPFTASVGGKLSWACRHFSWAGAGAVWRNFKNYFEVILRRRATGPGGIPGWPFPGVMPTLIAEEAKKKKIKKKK